MTKEQFLNKWVVISVVKDKMLPDLESVIATEIAKVKEVKPDELKGNCSTFDMSRLVDQEYKPTKQPALNPIEQAYERGEKIRHKNWLNGDWIQKHKETKTIDNHGNINSVYPFAFIQYPEKWELYTEPTEQPSSQVKLDNSFDKERFERLFRAVVVSIPNEPWDSTIKITQEGIDKLDAYYASKEGGANE